MPEKNTRTATKTVLPKFIQSMHDQHPMARTSKSLCTTMQVPTRPRSQHRIYRSRTSKSWTVHPTVPTLPPVTFLSKLKAWLAGWQFTRAQDRSKAIISERNAVPASEYHIQMWLRRLEFCVASGDMYFEGLYNKTFPFYFTCDRTFGLALILLEV